MHSLWVQELFGQGSAPGIQLTEFGQDGEMRTIYAQNLNGRGG